MVVMLHHISMDSENVVFLKQSHASILDGPKSLQFKSPKAQNAIKMGICHAKFMFCLKIHGIIDVVIVKYCNIFSEHSHLKGPNYKNR